MKKIFAQFGSGLGPLTRTLPILKELKESGYEVKYFGFKNAKKRMEEIGISELSDEDFISGIQRTTPVRNWYSAEQFWSIIGYNNAEWLNVKVDNLISKLKEFSPDIIFSDLGILSCIAAKIMGIPLVALNQSCYHPNRIYDRLRWWELPQNIETGLMGVLNDIFRKHGVRPLNKFEEIFTGELTLIPSFPEFDPISSLGEYNTHYIGPVFMEDSIAPNQDYPKLYNSDKRHKIFCYTARFNDNVGESGINIFKAMIGMQKELDAQLLVSTGSIYDKKIAVNILNENELSEDDIKIVDWIPMSVAYSQSDLVIHHGGHGSCLGQFIYNTPSLILPTHSEREYNARMLGGIGVSEFVEIEHLSSRDIALKVDKLLSYDYYQENLRYYNEVIRNREYDGAKQAIKIINKYL